jgi:GT2 family glycosyltransferase
MDSNGNGSGQNKPLVSVIIPAYQCAQYIAQAIDSVLAQSFSDYEIIVVNDGSPDTPLLETILRPYRSKITYLKQSTRGPASARNTAIHQAVGKYVAFLDSDDYWSPDHLAKQMALLESDHTLDLVYCDYFLVKGDSPVARSFLVEPQSDDVCFDSLLVERCVIGTSTTVISRHAIMRVGLFDESFIRCEDFELWLRMAFMGARMAYHSDPQVFHRMNVAGLSANRIAMRKDRIRVYQTMASMFPVSAEQRETIRALVGKAEADCHIDGGKQAVEQGDYETALKYINRARAISDRWKLRISAFALRLAPQLFRRFHLARERHLAENQKQAVERFQAPLSVGDGRQSNRAAQEQDQPLLAHSGKPHANN